MKKLKKIWDRAPRPLKVVCQLTAFLLFLLGIYIAFGSPAFSTEMAFRREEKANMVGPGRILAEFDAIPGSVKNIVADTEQLYILYSDNAKMLSVYQKTGIMALYFVPGCFPVQYFSDISNPVKLILFDLEPNAVRAEMEFELATYEEAKTFHVKAESRRQYEEFFIFDIYSENSDPIDSDAHVRYELMNLCSTYAAYRPRIAIRLYDANDNLIRTEAILPGPIICNRKRSPGSRPEIFLYTF